jgi:hypothetical protein
MSRLNLAKIALAAGLGLSLLANLAVAFLYLFAWAHYDGGDEATLLWISTFGWASFLLPLLACIYPGKLKLVWRLLISCATFAVCYGVIATHG